MWGTSGCTTPRTGHATAWREACCAHRLPAASATGLTSHSRRSCLSRQGHLPPCSACLCLVCARYSLHLFVSRIVSFMLNYIVYGSTKFPRDRQTCTHVSCYTALVFTVSARLAASKPYVCGVIHKFHKTLLMRQAYKIL